MRINGIDIARYGAKQYRVDFGQSELKNDTEWIERAALPLFSANYNLFKELTVKLLVYGDGRENIRNKISEIVSHLLEPAELELDGYARQFTGILTKADVDEGSDAARKRFQILKLQFDAYEHGERVVTEKDQWESIVQVKNPGNIRSPAVIEITPGTDLAALTVTGICMDGFGQDVPVTIESLKNGKTIKIDGITGVVEEDGAVKDIDIWTLPAVLPGESEITLSQWNMDLKITILPLYI